MFLSVPSFPRIFAHLIDYSKGTVLSSSILGEIKGTLGILKTERGYKMQIVKEMNCDCDAAFISDWLEVWVEQDQIKTAWMKPASCDSPVLGK